MPGSAGEIRRTSWTTFYELLCMDILVLVDQQKNYMHQLCADTRCHLEDLLSVMADRKSKKSVQLACLNDDIFICKSKVGNHSRGHPEDSLFNSYYYCREGCYSFPWIAPLYPWYLPYVAECQARRYQEPFLKSLVWRELGLNPGLPGYWRTFYPLDQRAEWYPYIVES